MSPFLRRLTPVAAVFGVILCFAAGCAVGPVGSYGYPNLDVGPGYYEPNNVDYGGWGGDYAIGPYGYGGGGWAGGGHAQHSFRGAGAGRFAPSIPGGRRGGGGRPGGVGRAGGGRAGGGGRVVR